MESSAMICVISEFPVSKLMGCEYARQMRELRS